MTRRPLPAQRWLASLTALCLLTLHLTTPPPSEASYLGSSSASAGSAPPPAISAIQSFQPDLFTGRATTSIPIAVPPGRKGMQPNLSLGYSSSARNGWVGVGWSLDVGSIERSTKNGVPGYTSSDTFTAVLQSVASDLVKISDGTYRAKDEGLFLRFEFKGPSGWEVRDPSGTRYFFGQTVNSQIENAGNVFRWALDKILDVNGNTLTVTYVKDQGQLYLSQMSYTGHDPSGLAPANRVDFLLETRPDVETNSRSGFSVTTAKRLTAIETRATVGASLVLARRYAFSYAPSGRTGRSMLKSVTQFGSDATTALPATTFSYHDADQPVYTVSTNNPSASTAAWNLREANQDTGHDNFGCVSPYAGLAWGSPIVVNGSATLSCLTATANTDGSVTVNGCQDHFFHAWTWVYVSQPTSLSLTYTGSEACVYREDANGLQALGGGGPVSTSLQPGWSIIHLTGYHQHAGYTNVMSSPLKSLVTIMSPSQFLKPQLAGDVDGNGITDLVTFAPSTGTWTVSCSRGGTSSPGTVWLSGFGDASSTPLLGDWNGDGRTDIAIYNNGSWRFATSTGTSFQADTIAPKSVGSGVPLVGDFNGDGLTDLGTYSNGDWQFAINTGVGFAASGSFATSWGTSNHEPLSGDFNGDGLTDIAVRYRPNGDIAVRLSTGGSFALDTKWLGGLFFSATSADVNGDGLTDVVYYDRSTGKLSCALSTGTQFATPTTLSPTFSLRSTDDTPQFGDFNGDGLTDLAIFNAVTGASEIASSQGSFTDLMAGIANGIGGSTTLEYQASTQCDNVCPIELVPKLPFVIPLVHRVTLGDGLGNSYTTNYTYQKGRYDAATREFRGFAHVEVRDPDANVSITEFSQDECTKGRPLHTEGRDPSNNLWTTTDHTWSCLEPYPGIHFAKLDQTDSSICEGGGATCKHVRTRISYDGFGNVIRTDEDGEVSVLGDERSTVTSYAPNDTVWILSKPSLVQTLNASGTVVSQRRFYYDGATTTTSAPLKGNLTKEEEWLNLPSTQWLGTSLAYDVYGNVTSITDALGRVTTNTYDPSGTYLVKITNAKFHQRQLAYDTRTGQVTTSTDQNNVTTRTEYDALGRVTKVLGPNDTSVLPTVSYSYDLSTAPTKTVVQTRIQSGQPDVLTSYAFADGLGRTIQTRSPAEDPAKQLVNGAVELNSRGLVAKQWVPYLDATSTSYVPTSSIVGLAAPILYSYDPLGRTTQVTDPDGSTTTTSYGPWSVTTTDANSHQTRRTNDAFGRLVKVEESNGPEIYATIYEYDTLNNLTAVTDAKSHVTRLAYDSLGRKLGMDDPDMGHWDYRYDAVDNLISQTDARGVTIAFTYDPLNRVIQKSYTIPAGSSVAGSSSPVSYTYDSQQQPYKGKLISIVDVSGNSTFDYDNLGRLIKETKTIDTTTYAIQRTYDLLGRLLTLTYPDNDVVRYTYNAQGGIETVTLQSPTSGLTTLVSDIDYNAAGQITKIVYGNGTSTDYTYHPQTLRLNRLVSTGPGGALQDFSYSFDPVGNVTAITDSVHTATQSFQYDPLNRLTQATGHYGTFSYRYDALGNLLDKEGASMTYGLPDGSKPHAVTSVKTPTADAWGLTYDADGNLTEKQSPVSGLLSQLFSYDAENRLVQVKTPPDQTITITLQPGWNLFSLPVVPADSTITVLLPTFANDVAQLAKFDASTGTFKQYVGDPTFDDFSTLDYGTGYEIYCKNPAGLTLTFTGKLPSKPLSAMLSAGWQLLPALIIQPTPTTTVFTGLDAASILRYDTTTSSLTTATQTAPGQSYYVQLRTGSTWMPPLPRDPTTQFVYDGDGGRVKQLTSTGTTKFLGQAYEIAPDGKTTKYVFAGSQRITAIETPAAGAALPAASQRAFARWWQRLLDALAIWRIPPPLKPRGARLVA